MIDPAIVPLSERSCRQLRRGARLAVMATLCIQWNACRPDLRGAKSHNPHLPLLVAELDVGFGASPAGGGGLSVSALLADSAHPLPSETRLPLTVRVSSGDHERFVATPHACVDRDPEGRLERAYPCGYFFVVADSARVLDELQRVGVGPGVRIERRLSTTATIRVDSGLVRDVMRRVARHPGVVKVERLGWGCAPPGGCVPRSRATMRAQLNVEEYKPCVGDDVVQGFPGDTIHVTYVQPNGKHVDVKTVITEAPSRYIGPSVPRASGCR